MEKAPSFTCPAWSRRFHWKSKRQRGDLKGGSGARPFSSYCGRPGTGGSKSLIRLRMFMALTMAIAVTVSAFAQQIADPSLAVSINAERAVRISWLDSPRSYILEESQSLTSGTWLTATETPILQGGLYSISLPGPPAIRFYRLRDAGATSAAAPSLIVSINADKTVQILRDVPLIVDTQQIHPITEFWRRSGDDARG